MFPSLFHSRKFWLTVIDVIQYAALSYTGNQELADAINVVLLFLIGSIAFEDAAHKLNIFAKEK